MNYIAWRLVNAAFRLANPLFWVQIKRTDYAFDAALRRALREHPVELVSEHRCAIGGAELWVSNYPYCFGHLMRGPECSRGLPAPLTRVALRKALTNAAMEASA
mgnify:CR=1 FL=1